jgi:hypothetical protein
MAVGEMMKIFPKVFVEILASTILIGLFVLAVMVVIAAVTVA